MAPLDARPLLFVAFYGMFAGCAQGASDNSLPFASSSTDSPADSDSPASVATQALQPNLLLIVLDDLGVDKVGAYADDFEGYRQAATNLPATPNMDHLGAAGLRFSKAWANPTCAPTRAALLTGRYGFRTGVGAVDPFGPPLGTDEHTFASALSEVGYSTALFGKWHLGTEGSAGTVDWALFAGEESRTVPEAPNPLRFGWQHYDGGLKGELDDYYAWTRVVATTGADATITLETDYATDVTTAAATSWMAGMPEPWLAMVAYNAPHADGVGNTYELDDVGPDCPAGAAEETDAAIYAAVAGCVDDQIGRLIAGIPEEQLANTLVVLVGDNGTDQVVMEGPFNFNSNHEYGKGSTFETGLRVPLFVVSGQRLLELAACEEAGQADCPTGDTYVAEPGRVVDGAVDVVDLAATLASLGQASFPEAVDGLDTSGCLSGESCDTRETLYAETFSYNPEGGLDWARAAVRVGDDKLTVNYVVELDCMNYMQYDLAEDPFEQENVCGDEPDLLSSLKEKMTQVAPSWMDGIAACE